MARAQKKQTPGYQELKAELRQDQCRNLYVLYGDEPFLIEKLVDGLIEYLIAPGSRDLDRVVLHGDGQPGKIDFYKLKAEVQTPPFLSRRKLVIVKNCGWLTISGSGRAGKAADDDSADDNGGGMAQKERQQNLAQLIGHLPDSVCLVIIEDKVDRRLKNLIKDIEKTGVLAELSRQPARILQAWIEGECRRRQLTIDSLAAESLIDRCDSSMHVIWQELSKLFLYCEHSGISQVDLALIADISLPDLRGTVFDLTDALTAGQTEKALLLLDTLIGQKQPVQLISFMLARHIRQLICAAELKGPDQIASTLKVMPFIARRLSQQARLLSLPLLEALYGRCYETDLQVKTGRISDRLGLETLLITTGETMRYQLRR